MADSSKVIKSVNYNQHAILRDIMDLHMNGEPFDVDTTYSIGNFYGKFKRTIQEKQDDGCIIEKQEEFKTLIKQFDNDIDILIDILKEVKDKIDIYFDYL